MKKSASIVLALVLLGSIGCKKNETASEISLTASATQATIGETVAVTLSSSANASRWSVSPSTATAAYTITTSKVNYFTFNQPGVYTVSVSARAVNYDSSRHQSLDSCWNHAGNRSCIRGVDSASVQISVVK